MLTSCRHCFPDRLALALSVCSEERWRVTSGHAPILSILPSGDERIRPEKPLIKQDFPVHFPLAELKLKMANPDSRVTIHMAASLDGFIARKDGRVDWMETSDEFAGGDNMDPGFVEAFLKTIDCYVMGSRTYETALSFEAKGFGWPYGDKPTFVLTSRDLPQTRHTVEFYSGDLAQFVNGHLRPRFRTIWFVGGGAVSGECLRLGLADEVRYSILPILIGDGIRFFEKLDRDIVLHLAEVKAYKSGMVELRYQVRGHRGGWSR